MNAIPTPVLMTTEQMLALPLDGMDRELIHGELREKPLTQHNRRHSRTEANVTFFLQGWLVNLPEPRGEVLSGEAGFRILRDPDTTVGIDVAYISAELAAATPDNARLVDGAPTVAVEILSPSNNWGSVVEKLRDYLAAGVPLVWILDPEFRTVTVYRPGAEPELFNARQELSGDPHLPGFRVEVARLFGR